MANMWFLILPSLALLSQGAYIDSCSYVKTTTDTSVTPIHWGFVYPMDVCMTYVDSGTATYKKYVCNDALEVKEEIWDTDMCDTALSTTQDPTVTVEDFSCETYGECEYMTVKYMDSDCSTATTYKEEAIIPEECVNAVIGVKSFRLLCSDQTLSLYSDTTTCSNTASNTEDLSSSCQNIGSLTGFNPLGYWDVTSACLSITYANPTNDPTQQPTIAPSDVVVNATESSEGGASLYITFIANVIIAIVLSLAI